MLTFVNFCNFCIITNILRAKICMLPPFWVNWRLEMVIGLMFCCALRPARPATRPAESAGSAHCAAQAGSRTTEQRASRRIVLIFFFFFIDQPCRKSQIEHLIALLSAILIQRLSARWLFLHAHRFVHCSVVFRTTAVPALLQWFKLSV